MIKYQNLYTKDIAYVTVIKSRLLLSSYASHLHFTDVLLPNSLITIPFVSKHYLAILA